ncbi:hypothetical protein ROHU_000243 [Labeo rohita]|uniref:Uncharacterized protein n=1 Tax=Labeo rohita TaxID=84645 RepID=A0A498P3X8_LABRO|nr:hypothetical protein ROHU_000243 [Labeo rohita]
MRLRPQYKTRGVDTPENDCENLIPSGARRLDGGARTETANATFAFKKVTFAMLVWRRRHERRDSAGGSFGVHVVALVLMRLRYGACVLCEGFGLAAVIRELCFNNELLDADWKISAMLSACRPGGCVFLTGPISLSPSHSGRVTDRLREIWISHDSAAKFS